MPSAPQMEGANSSDLIMHNTVERLLNTRLDEDERFMENIIFIRNLNPDSNLNERNLQISLENRELELNNSYMENFEKINQQVQQFVDKIRQMNTICHDLTNRIQSNKEKTRDLLKKTSVLQNEKKSLTAKQEYLDNFFAKYYLTEDESHALMAPKVEGNVTEFFFQAFKRLISINDNVSEQLKLNSDNLSLLEISGYLQGKLDSAFQILHQCVLRECRLLNVEFLDMKLTVCQSLEYLQMRPDLFESAWKEYSSARKGSVVRTYIDALTKGKSGINKPIESFSSEPIRYVVEMFTWIETCISTEKELVLSVLKNCRPDNVRTLMKDVLSIVTEALCQPLKIRVEQIVSKENNPCVIYKFLAIFLYYAKKFENEVNENCVLVRTLYDLYKLTSNMFFSLVSSTVQRILNNMTVPDYDLMPVNAVHQTLLLLRDIMESQTDFTFTSVIDKKEMHSKIFMHILDPLHQSIQLVCSNLHNHLDVAVYMLNCLNTIRSVVILYSYIETKLEMIKAQIDANEDVLVSEQASQILINCDLMDIYTKSLAHRANQGPLSKISGMEPERISKAISLFNNFLQVQDGFQCHQAVKISSIRIRESVQTRTFENVIAAYDVIFKKLKEDENDYGELQGLKTTDEVRSILLK